jgi:hypothetical protein
MVFNSLWKIYTMKNTKKNLQQDKPAPVADGDSRPDQSQDGENSAASPKSAGNKGNQKLSSNRHGDINSLEDFKDAK